MADEEGQSEAGQRSEGRRLCQHRQRCCRRNETQSLAAERLRPEEGRCGRRGHRSYRDIGHPRCDVLLERRHDHEYERRARGCETTLESHEARRDVRDRPEKDEREAVAQQPPKPLMEAEHRPHLALKDVEERSLVANRPEARKVEGRPVSGNQARPNAVAQSIEVSERQRDREQQRDYQDNEGHQAERNRRRKQGVDPDSDRSGVGVRPGSHASSGHEAKASRSPCLPLRGRTCRDRLREGLRPGAAP